jgi:hypothetical protein
MNLFELILSPTNCDDIMPFYEAVPTDVFEEKL